MTLFFAVFVEIFFLTPLSRGVLRPLSKIISKNNHPEKIYRILFGMRIVILLFCGIFISPNVVLVDFILLFMGICIIIPIYTKITGTSPDISLLNNDDLNIQNNSNNNSGNVILKCAKCGNTLKINDKFCRFCGTPINGNNVQRVQDTSPIVNFDNTYFVNTKTILRNMIIEDLKKQGDNINKLTTKKLNRNKNILLIIFGILSFINVILFYLNYSILLCSLIEIIMFIIYLIINRKFNTLNVLIKKTIKNPDEDISKIIDDFKAEKQELIIPNVFKLAIVIFIVLFIPTMIFYNPKVVYTRYGDGYQVFRYTRSIMHDDEVVIPDTYKGKKVLAIGEKAFKDTTVKQVSLPNTIESIKIDAFKNAKNIEKMVIPSSVIEIRANAFSDMTNLKYISLPEGLKDIRGGAFANDINLTNVELPSTLEYLGGRAFSHCSSITEITIPKKVTEINGATFEYMTSLRTINLHDDITYIHGEVFVGDVSLDNVKLPSKITEIKGNTFENCSSLSTIIIPVGVTRIGGHAFYGCSSLNYVYVPRTVTEIGSSAFRRCSSLRSITIPRNAVVNERAFKESPTVIQYYNDSEVNYE